MGSVDPFARFRTGDNRVPQPAPEPAKNASPYVDPTPVSVDPFERFRVEGPNIVRPNNTLGEEFRSGLSAGVDSLQAGLYGTAGLMGRELGISWMEDAGMKGAAENFEQASRSGRQSGGFTDIENAGGFFKWTAASLGEAIPSLALAMTGGGIGLKVGHKAVELGVKKSLARSVERRLAKYGFSREEALVGARDYMTSRTGQTALARAYTGERTGALIAEASATAGKIGGAAGGVAAAALPMIGQIDQELISSGVADPGLTALVAGVAGGALEAVPALRLLDRMFPGLDRQVSKAFVKDFAVATGTQAAIEGSTEAAQEIIQLAALAYKDPTFDMFSPDAKKRVIDAFAAGALVGTVTGGGAEVIGQAQSGAFAGVKKAVPVIGAWSMTAKDAATDAAAGISSMGTAAATDISAKVEEQLPEGFVAADNTLFQEIKGRVYATVQPHIEAAVNSVTSQMDKITSELDSSLEGGVNAETAKMSDVAKAARVKFLKDWGPQIEGTKAYLRQQTERIARGAKAIKDPEARGAYIEGQATAVKERLAGVVEKIRQAAARMNQEVEAEVDNMDMDDDMLNQLGVEIEEEQTERRIGPSGRKFDRSVGPAPEATETFAPRNVAQTGETESAPVMTFGLNQQRPRIGVNGKEDVVPYRTKAIAEKGRTTLRKRFPGVKNDDVFRIKQHESGKGWIIEVISPEVMEDQKFFTDLEGARDSAIRRKANDRKVTLSDFEEGHWGKFGFREDMENLEIDVQTMAYKGKNIDPNAKTDMEGFMAFAGEMLQRGMINEAQFEQMLEKAKPLFQQNDKNETASYNDRVIEERAKEAKATEEGGFAPPIAYGSKGQAWRSLIEFKEEMDLQGVPYPFSDKEKGWSGDFSKGSKIFDVVQDENGTWQWGLNRRKTPRSKNSGTVNNVKALRAKDANAFDAIMDAMHNRRRSEALDKANRERGDFSGNPEAVSGSGTIGDRTGATAGAPDVRAAPILTGRDGQGGRTAGRDTRIQTREEGETSQNLFPEGGQQDFATQTGGFGQRTGKNQRTIPLLEETRESKQQTDRATDPDNLESEFQDRKEELKRTSSRKNSQTSKNARSPQTAQDNAHLKRYGRPGNVKTLLAEKTPKKLREAITGLANYVTKTLGLSNQITVLDNSGLAWLIKTGKVTDPIFEQTLNDPSVKARNIRIGDNSFIYLSPEVLSDPVMATLAFGHEMGHHVYRVAWDNLTPEGKDQLRRAYMADRRTDAKDVFEGKLGSIDEDFDEAGFNEWMADQLASWIAQPRLPQGPVQAFFAKVGAQIRKLYDFMSNNPRFQLNQTFKDFADAIALKAKNPHDAAANPYNDAQIKAWFRNEGVTMYGWFGQALKDKDGKRVGAKQGTREVDNMAFDFAPATIKSQKALARMAKKMPALAKRVVAIRNWTQAAWNLAAMPSTHVMRNLAETVPAAAELVKIFGPRPGNRGDAKGKQNYYHAVQLMRAQFMKQYTTVTDSVAAKIKKERPGIKDKELKTLVNAEMRRVGKSLVSKEGKRDATFTETEQAVRNLFDAMHEYARKAGLPVRKITNYYTRQFDTALLEANRQKILDYLVDVRSLPLERARSLYNSLIDPNANDGRATQDATETPGYKAMNSRHAQDTFFDQFRETNTDSIIANYVNQVVKRAEFNRRLGEAMPATELDAKKAIKEGIWDPKGKMHKILRDARKQKASDEQIQMMEKYIDANLGQLGRDSAIAQPGMRKMMATVMAYQNMRVLLFTVFASMPDMVGPAIRSGSMRRSFKVMKDNIAEIAKSDSDLATMAHTLGIVQDTVSEHIMTEYVDNHYMPPKLRKMNDEFFKWTGLNWYTDFTRKAALAVGIDYIENSYKDSIDTSKPERTQIRAKAALAELGLTQEQAKSWIEAGKPTYNSQAHDMAGPERAAADALVQFVDETIMRPNAAQRPILASHPGAMLMYHLKGYMYAISEVMLGRMAHNFREAQSPMEHVSAIAPAIAMLALTAVGLELRELIQYAGSSRKPPTDRMDGLEYMTTLVERAGLMGYYQIGFDFQGAEDRGMSELAAIGGPAMSQVGDLLSKPHTQTIPKAIPIMSQIPALRDAMRTML